MIHIHFLWPSHSSLSTCCWFATACTRTPIPRQSWQLQLFIKAGRPKVAHLQPCLKEDQLQMCICHLWPSNGRNFFQRLIQVKPKKKLRNVLGFEDSWRYNLANLSDCKMLHEKRVYPEVLLLHVPLYHPTITILQSRQGNTKQKTKRTLVDNHECNIYTHFLMHVVMPHGFTTCYMIVNTPWGFLGLRGGNSIVGNRKARNVVGLALAPCGHGWRSWQGFPRLATSVANPKVSNNGFHEQCFTVRFHWLITQKP